MNPRTTLVLFALALSTLPACALPSGEPSDQSDDDLQGAGQRIVVDVTTERFAVRPVLLGANVNKWYDEAQGLWNTSKDAPDPDALAKIQRANLGLLRYPGGTAANLFDWKRAVGPRSSRRCQVDAQDGTPRPDSGYGPAEFGRFVQAAGAAGEIMVPFARMTPEDAADWVEYMNAPLGTNPNGGVAWAEVRAADGSPEPFHITRWEIGNEQDRGGEGYWMADGIGPTRLRQYIDGDDFAVNDQPLARDCDFSAATTTSAAGQTFYFHFGLVKAGTFPTVHVGADTWTRVSDLASAGPRDQVYAFDRQSGSIQFGDGTHGAIPPHGERVTASYRLHHDGFAAIYDKMKATAAAMHAPIDVCAIWAPPSKLGSARSDMGTPSFAQAMKARGLASHYDCVVMHPYISFARDFGTVWGGPATAHDQMMVGDRWAQTMLQDLVDDVHANGKPGVDGRSPYVAVSEFGALWFDTPNLSDPSLANAPTSNYGMSHALYMASQWVHDARMHLGWVEGNTVVAGSHKELRGVLGGQGTGFLYGAEAMTREAIGPVFARGATWVASKIDNAEVMQAIGGGSYGSLEVGATVGKDGELRILVVNRRRHGVSTALVVPGGFTHARAVDVTTVRGASFDSADDGPGGPGDDTVSIRRSTETFGTGPFDYDFPAASVTVLTLRP